jgi:hypothetical protein
VKDNPYEINVYELADKVLHTLGAKGLASYLVNNYPANAESLMDYIQAELYLIKINMEGE